MVSKSKTTGFREGPPDGNQNNSQVSDRAKGRWLNILPDLAPQLQAAVDNLGEHVPCPVHGGKDGFRLFPDADDTGGGICNSCGSFPTGFRVLEWANGWAKQRTMTAVSDWIDTNGQNCPVKNRPVAGSGLNQNARQMIERITGEAKDDPGRVAAYLHSRGLLGEVPESVRFHPGLPLFEGKKQVDTLPALVAPYQRDDGQIVGYLRIYLAPDGSGKADIGKPKKNTPALWRGAINGAVIRLSDPGEVLGIAEGVETALAVMESTGMPVWAAGSAGGLEAAELPEETATVYIWADQDPGGRGEAAALKLAERLLQEGRSVYVALPEQKGQDWLDVLNQQGKGAVLRGMEEAVCYELAEDDNDGFIPADIIPASDMGRETDDIIDELNEHHFIVNVGGKVCIANLFHDPQTDREDLTLSSISDFKLRYSNRFSDPDTTIAQLWLSSPNRRQYDGIVFLPNQEVKGFYNLFQGFPIKPIPGDCSLYWEHVRNNICSGNDVHYRWVRRWMAHGIQHPEQLPGTAIVLRGLQGVGKGVFVENYGTLFGQHYVSIYRLDQVTGRFNGHIKNVILLHANEATCKNDKVGEGVLKGLITDPFIPVEHKGKDIISLRNYKRIIVATNEEWAVPMGMDDRRYIVLDVDPSKKEDKAYFQAIFKQMENGGLQALMHDLLTEDLTGFDVRTVPYSPTGFSQKLHTASPLIQWWFDGLCDGQIIPGPTAISADGWNQQPTHDQLYTAYSNWCRESRMTPQSKPIFGRTFRKLLPGIEVGESRRLINSDDSEWIDKSKRQRCYILPSLEECREAFQRFSKSGPEIWPKDIED